jgi:hypothetical protein
LAEEPSWGNVQSRDVVAGGEGNRVLHDQQILFWRKQGGAERVINSAVNRTPVRSALNSDVDQLDELVITSTRRVV